jgi:hypothetical protein
MIGKAFLILTGLAALMAPVAGCSTAGTRTASSAVQTQTMPPPNQTLTGVPPSAGTSARVQTQGTGAASYQRP